MRRILLPLCTRLRSAELRRGFTMIELLLVIGIIAILASIVIVAINPTKQLASARDAKRRHEANQIEKALSQYLIDKGVFPVTIPEGSSAVKPVCREGQSDASCLDFDLLTPDYLVTIPQDPSETNVFFSGYQAYLQSGRPQVLSTYLTGTVQIITSGLVGYWKFDETSGTVAADSSGSGNAGTHTNGPVISSTVAPMQFTNARSLSFDGTDDYVIINDSNSLDSTNALTISYWERMTIEDNNAGVVFKGSLAGSQGVYSVGHYTGGNTKVVFRLNGSTAEDSGQITSSTAIVPGTWYHITVTYDRTNMKMYINGVLEKTNSYTPAIATNTDPLHIGAYYSGANTVPSTLDDVRIYNRALNPAEITQIASGNG